MHIEHKLNHEQNTNQIQQLQLQEKTKLRLNCK